MVSESFLRKVALSRDLKDKWEGIGLKKKGVVDWGQPQWRHCWDRTSMLCSKAECAAWRGAAVGLEKKIGADQARAMQGL